MTTMYGHMLLYHNQKENKGDKMKRNLIPIMSILLLLAANVSAQMRAYALVGFQGPVELVVTDSQGKRSGYDPITNTDYDEITYAFYGDGSVEGSKEFGFRRIRYDTLITTTYTIQVFGTGNGTFMGDALARQTWNPQKGGQFHTEGVIDSNQTVSYKFSYSTDSTITPTFWKVVTPQIIEQDFNDCFKLKLLGDRGFYRELRNQLDDFDRYIEHRDSVEAGRELEGFWDRLKKVYADTLETSHGKEHEKGRTGKFERGHRDFVKQEAYQILSEDVSLMMAQLSEGHGGGDK
jgi:hypothetical protein